MAIPVALPVPGEPARILLAGARRWEWWRTHV